MIVAMMRSVNLNQCDKKRKNAINRSGIPGGEMRNILIGSMANQFNSLNVLGDKNQEFSLSVFLLFITV